jgi:sulfate adenylyltransferase subunit 2
MWKTEGLKQALDHYGFDVAFGGARRDEEKSRAKERVFSFRSANHRWDPKNQRPELWNLYNARSHKGENIRAFPISNWTEMDVWQYIERENLELPSIYFAHQRDVVIRGGAIFPVNVPLASGEILNIPKAGEQVLEKRVRFRTVGDITCTAPVESDADTLGRIVLETATTTITDRGATRLDDQTSEASMEQRKKEGYF